jgi:uncharacterized protein YprB with RNaseH-like and TPR domain
MDLRDKLGRLDPPHPVQGQGTGTRSPDDLRRHVSGSEVRGDNGSFFLSTSDFEPSHSHGFRRIDAFLGSDPSLFALAGRDHGLSSINPLRAVFLDTETTGLAGGTGTVPFLVGLGFFENGRFRLEQHFMRDFHEERAVLEAVRERLDGAGFLITYNGKGFDVNLLATRFTLARLRTRIREVPHLDLLYTARRLWKRRLLDCSLSHIERRILGFEREGDVPGFLIPGLYFDYLRTGNGAPMAGVFRHNALDILALAALTGSAVRMYADPDSEIGHPLDWISLGRSLESFGRYADAARCFERALENPLPPHEREEALVRLGFSLKRAGDWKRMLPVWELFSEHAAHRVLGFEELAKYHEHHSGDLDLALHAVERAMERLRVQGTTHRGPTVDRQRAMLERRLERLMRKRNPSTGTRGFHDLP